MLALFPAERERTERAEPTTRCCMLALLGALPVRNIFQLELESTGKPMPTLLSLSPSLSLAGSLEAHTVCVRVSACVCV